MYYNYYPYTPYLFALRKWVFLAHRCHVSNQLWLWSHTTNIMCSSTHERPAIICVAPWDKPATTSHNRSQHIKWSEDVIKSGLNIYWRQQQNTFAAARFHFHPERGDKCSQMLSRIVCSAPRWPSTSAYDNCPCTWPHRRLI